MKIVNSLLVFVLIFFLVWLSSAQNMVVDCQYKEIKETQEYTQVLYDKASNKYENVTEIQNIAGDQGRISFDIINKIPITLSIKVTYDISHSGGSFWPNNEESHDIESLGKVTITNTGSSGILWGTSSVNNIRISYLSNKDIEVKTEKKKEERCKQCGGLNCLNDNSKCIKDSQCGSGICDIGGYCGRNKIVDCPTGLKNCNNKSCLTSNTKKEGQSYLCDFECKSGYGKNGICEITFKDKTLRYLFIFFSLVVLIVIIYFIWTNKFLGGKNVAS